MPAMRQHKPFLKLFESFMGRWSAWQVWADWVQLLAISVVNAVDVIAREKRAETYARIIERYNDEEQEVLAQMSAEFFSAMEENPHQDLLGSLFMCLALGNHWAGQFFTPYSVCEAMARLQMDKTRIDQIISQRGFVRVSDVACGAGATLVAARNELAALGVSGDQAWFVAQDVDRTAALMCYLQLAALGCAGYICIGDTLENPTRMRQGFLPVYQEGNEIWMLPYTYMGAWPGRIWAAQMDRIKGRMPEKRAREPVCAPTGQELPGQVSLW